MTSAIFGFAYFIAMLFILMIVISLEFTDGQAILVASIFVGGHLFAFIHGGA